MGLNELIILLAWLGGFLIAVVAGPILWEKRASIVAGLSSVVNHFVEIRRSDPADYVEEEDEEDRPVSRPSEPSAPSVLRTDGDQRLTKEAVLDICKHLRARGYSRDAARELFTLMGAAFSNDIWTKAAPPERKDEYITPFAGRVTDKKYYPDNPDLEYAPPSS